MITLFSGIPRSGKSYKMVCEVWKNKDSYYVIHNIKGFKTELLNGYGFDWSRYIQDNNIEADVFFSQEYQIRLSEKINEKYNRPILMIIDEAHEWFDVHKKAIKMWLSYHGHLNQKIYLVAHASTNIPKVYRSFVEIEYRAKNSTLLFLPNIFIYNRISGGVRVGYTYETKRKKIFDLYNSSEIKEDRPKKSLFIPIAVTGVVIGFVLFLKAPSLIFKNAAGPKKAEAQTQFQSINKNINMNVNSVSNKVFSSGFYKNDFEARYAYIGEMGGQIVIEERQTGRQFPVSRLAGNYRVVMSDRNNNCVLTNNKGDMFELTNVNRYQARPNNNGSIIGLSAEPVERQQSATGEAISNDK